MKKKIEDIKELSEEEEKEAKEDVADMMRQISMVAGLKKYGKFWINMVIFSLLLGVVSGILEFRAGFLAGVSVAGVSMLVHRFYFFERLKRHQKMVDATIMKALTQNNEDDEK